MTYLYESRNEYPRKSPRNSGRDKNLHLTTKDAYTPKCETSSTDDDSSSSNSYALGAGIPRNRYIQASSKNRKTDGSNDLFLSTKDTDEYAIDSTLHSISPLNSHGEDSISKYIEKSISPINGLRRIQTLRSNSMNTVLTFKSRASMETVTTQKHRNTHRYAAPKKENNPKFEPEYQNKSSRRYTPDKYHTQMNFIEETDYENICNYQNTSSMSPPYPLSPLPPTTSHNPDSRNKLSVDKKSGTKEKSGKKEHRPRRSSLRVTRKTPNNSKRLNAKSQSPGVRSRKNNTPSDFWSEYFPGLICCTATSVIIPPNDLKPDLVLDKYDIDTSEDAIVLQEIKKICAPKASLKNKNHILSNAQGLLDKNEIVADLAESEKNRLKDMNKKYDTEEEQDVTGNPLKEFHPFPDSQEELSHEFIHNSFELDTNDNKVDDMDRMTSLVDAQSPQIPNENRSYMEQPTDVDKHKSRNSQVVPLQSISGPKLGTFKHEIQSSDDIISGTKSPPTSEFVGTYGKFRMDDKFVDEIMKDLKCSVPLYHTVLKVRGTDQIASYVDKSNISMCSETFASSFNVRGPTYKTDEKKMPSQESMFGLLGIDFFRCKGKNDANKNMCGKLNSFYSRLSKLCNKRGYSAPFLFVVNFVTPFGNLIAYFYRPDSEGHAINAELLNKPAEKLWEQFLDGDQNYRNERLKFIPNIHAGPWMVKKLVGAKPALIGQKIPTTYYGSREENYLEVCFDVAKGGSVANSICSTCAGKSDIITVDLCFLVEGLDVQELPEHILASLRLHHIKVKKCPTLDEWNEQLKKNTPND